MKKNYFKFLMAIAMMLGGVSLTSCDEMLDNPVEEPTEQTEEPKIVETETGAKITINKLSDVSGLLGELKTVIEKFQTENPGKQFVLDIETTATLEATETDYTLLIPNLSEFNIVINLNGNLVTSAKPLTLKLDQKAGTRDEVGEKIKTNYDNVITLNLKNDDIDLILDVPGTTVFINKLNSIQILNGVSVVKDGGSINTYVWAPTRNDYEMYNGEPEWVEFTESGDGWSYSNYRPNVRYTNGDSYHFKNLKIVKGKADYARINVWTNKYKLDMLTIDEGAVVVLNQTPLIKEIVGLGDNGGTIKCSSMWWTDEAQKIANADFYLQNVEKIYNVSIEPLAEGEYKDCTFGSSYLGEVPSALEACTIKYSSVNFRDSEAMFANVKDCKFVGDSRYKNVDVTIPVQTKEVPSSIFTFQNCEFVKDCKFSCNWQSSVRKKDANGDYIKIARGYCYLVKADEGGWRTSYVSNKDDMPADVLAAGEIKDWDDMWVFDNEGNPVNKGYYVNNWDYEYESVTYKDYYFYLSFENCLYGGTALTKDTEFISYAGTLDGTHLRFTIDGKTYRAIRMYDPEKEGDKYTWVLIEAND